MPKREPVLRYKGSSSSATGTRTAVSESLDAVDHGLLVGLSDDDHPQYAALAQDEAITGDWTFSGTVDLSGATVSLDCAAPDADSVNVAASSEGSNTTYSRSDHTHNLDEGISPTWTAGHAFQATMTTYDIFPAATDTYDLGSSTYWFSQMFVSQINAAVFAEEQIMLLGGWLYVSHDAGSFAAEVGSADTTIDFGKAMTVSDFVVVKAYDKTGSIKTEYIQVGALDAGTVYNVTRDLAAAHGTDPNWSQGTPFAVLGQTGDGRIELNAYDAPRIQIIVQDDAVTYSNTTEYLRLGEMNGAFGSDAAGEFGFGVGDYSGGNYVAYNTTDGFEVKAGAGAVRLDSSGVRLLETGTSTSYISWKETDYDGDTIAYMTTTWDGGGADDVKFFLASYKAAGLSAGDATLEIMAWDADGGNIASFKLDSGSSGGDGGYLYLNSSGQLSLNVDPGGISNSNMTLGLCMNQDTADDEIICCKSADVGHGAYQAETDVFFTVSKAEGSSGGAALRGYKDSDGLAGAALIVQAYLDENADTTHSTAGRGIAEVSGFQTSGGAQANTVADGNVVAFRTQRGGSVVTVVIIDEDGDIHLDGSTSAYDDHDDALVVRSLAQGLAQNWNDTLEYNFDKLRELGIISGGTPDRPFVSTKRLNALLMGAVGQLNERLQAVERAVA